MLYQFMPGTSLSITPGTKIARQRIRALYSRKIWNYPASKKGVALRETEAVKDVLLQSSFMGKECEKQIIFPLAEGLLHFFET